MNKFLKNNWVGIVLVLALGIFFYFAIKKGLFNTNKSEAIDPTTGAQDGSNTTLSNAQITNRAKSVHDAFVNHYLFWDSDPAKQDLIILNNLRDADLIAVANKFSELYAGETENTLKALLQAETIGWGEVAAMRDTLVDRLNILNL